MLLRRMRMVSCLRYSEEDRCDRGDEELTLSRILIIRVMVAFTLSCTYGHLMADAKLG